MKKIIIILLILGGVTNLFAQVSTQYFEKGKAFEKHPELQISKQNSPEKKMPLFDIAPLLAEDEAVKGMDVPFRFGKSFDVNISLEDGEWQKKDSIQVWSLRISSDGAYSLNLIFSELYLPEGGELYIYNNDGSMVYGPVTDELNDHGNTFLTDIIQGEVVTIQISIPEKIRDKPKLIIQNVIHGYKNIFQSLAIGYGQSGSCNLDAVCYSSILGDEMDGVVQILLANGIELCTGGMLNNTAQDYRPYILTAFHCINANKDKVLSTGEITAAENWLVRFKFRHSTCGGSTFDNVRTYTNTNFRAAWHPTDFALVELEYNVINDFTSVGEKVWLGWDRTGNSPSLGYYLHHPSGDVLSYARDGQSIPETGLGVTSGQNYWYSQIDFGTLESGSSGSPLFNQNKLVVGQLNGGLSNSAGCDGTKKFWHGCIHRSWIGGGQSDNQLSFWLQPSGSPTATTLNSLRQPTPQYFGGADPLCSTTTFSVINLAPGYSVNHWNGNNVTFPNGNTGSSVQVAPGSDGQGWVEAVINIGWGTYTMPRKYFGIGKPIISYITGPMSTPNNQWATYNAVLQNSASAPFDYEWILSPLNGNSVYDYGWTADIAFYNSGYYQVVARAQNTCGWGSYAVLGVAVYDSKSLSFSPNPTSSETILSIESTSEEKAIDETEEWELEIYDNVQLYFALKAPFPGLLI